MARRPTDQSTMDLFSWTPPTIAKVFDQAKVRAASLRAIVSKAGSLALKECGKSRDQVSQEIGDFLGEGCPKNMLDAYSAESRESHNISLIRFIALVHATRDMRLLNMIAEMFGWAVIPKKYLAAVEEAMWADQEERATRERLAARRRWKGGL